MDRTEAFNGACDLESADRMISRILAESSVLLTLCRLLDLRHLVVSTDNKEGEAVMDLVAEVSSFGFKLCNASDALRQRIQFDMLDRVLDAAVERAGRHVPPGK